MARALVVGYGSIGQRHTRVLSDLGHEVAVVSRRAIEHPRRYADLAPAMTEFGSDYVVIANETSLHRPTLLSLATLKYRGTVLVEKPLYDHSADDVPCDPERTFVAYNLRFHPLVRRLRDWLHGRTAVATTIYVGQHLSTWRPHRDYRLSYSSNRALGGGALRDLSHELDYALWLFGPWRRVSALGGASGTLGVDADDRWSILLECDRCPQVNISLSYLDHAPRRQIVVNARDDTACVDFIGQSFSAGDGRNPERIETDRDESYRRQHMAILSGESGHACSYSEGLAVMNLISAIEEAARCDVWFAAKN